jgi:hypothetical protein
MTVNQSAHGPYSTLTMQTNVSPAAVCLAPRTSSQEIVSPQAQKEQTIVRSNGETWLSVRPAALCVLVRPDVSDVLTGDHSSVYT